MIDEYTMQGWAVSKGELEHDFPYLSSIGPDVKGSKVILTTLEELCDENNPLEISFQTTTIEQAREFNNLINSELRYRQLPTDGTL
jgi:hypothetical protein